MSSNTWTHKCTNTFTKCMWPRTHLGGHRPSFDQIPLNIRMCGDLPACGSRHSRWPRPAFIRPSFNLAGHHTI
ncbi:hypothetical protein RHGRI_009658 [Rhododendron griersonianum]|uniref:Uncharacterized protein n=1 Tax=Rhododendron griersonianum TaxID=479676 RepID=A0AAV6KG74_9ERIC|nr:hypothetical protein RHGRI_009658 [Rhododendron griersonianum]